MTDGKQRIALLIDADNASAANTEQILEKLNRKGCVDVLRANGDEPQVKPWKAALRAHRIKDVQFAHTKGKNATDIALVIGAMELVHLRSVDAFGLVSSDADFTQLAKHLTGNGIHVYGFGEGKTPASLRDACTAFTVVPARGKRSKVKAMGHALASPSRLVTPAGGTHKLCADPAFLQALKSAVIKTRAKSGWAHVGRVRTEIGEQPFDLRGSGKFSKLLAATGLFEIRWVGLVAQVRVKPTT
jgi:hypothetical protein